MNDTDRSQALNALRAQAAQYAKDHLAQCAAELLEMQDTGTLCDGHVRKLSQMCLAWSTAASALPLALSLVHRAALEQVERTAPRLGSFDVRPGDEWELRPSETASRTVTSVDDENVHFRAYGEPVERSCSRAEFWSWCHGAALSFAKDWAGRDALFQR